MQSSRAYIVVGAIIIVIAVVTALFFARKKETTSDLAVSVVRHMPEIVFKNFDGQDFLISSLKGRLILLHIWASWCSLCTRQITDIADLQKEFGDSLIVAEINRGETIDTIKKYIDQLDRDHSLLFLADGNDALYKEIKGFAMPEMILIDKDGIIRDHTRGVENAETIRRRIQDILAL